MLPLLLLFFFLRWGGGEGGSPKIDMRRVSSGEVKIIGRLDTRIIRVLLGKQPKEGVIFESMKAAASAFYDELSQHLKGTKPSASLQENPWRGGGSPVAQPPPTMNFDGMAHYDSSGNIIRNDMTAWVQGLGFKVKSIIVHKSDKTAKHEIIEIGSDIKAMRIVDQEKITISPDCFQAQWSMYEEVEFPNSDEYSAKAHTGFVTMATKGAIAIALHSLSTGQRPSVCMQLKPYKTVIAAGKCKVGSLVLTPESTNIVAKVPGEKQPANGIEVKTANAPDQSIVGPVQYFITPPSMSTDCEKKPLNAAYWLVKATEDPVAVNMTRETMKVITSVKNPGQAFSTDTQVVIPVYKNSKELNRGDELFVLKVDSDTVLEEKSSKPDKSKPAGKAKGKAKADAKAQPTKRKRST